MQRVIKILKLFLKCGRFEYILKAFILLYLEIKLNLLHVIGDALKCCKSTNEIICLVIV